MVRPLRMTDNINICSFDNNEVYIESNLQFEHHVHSAQHHVKNNVITASSFFEGLMSQIKNERKVLT